MAKGNRGKSVRIYSRACPQTLCGSPSNRVTLLAGNQLQHRKRGGATKEPYCLRVRVQFPWVTIVLPVLLGGYVHSSIVTTGNSAVENIPKVAGRVTDVQRRRKQLLRTGLSRQRGTRTCHYNIRIWLEGHQRSRGRRVIDRDRVST